MGANTLAPRRVATHIQFVKKGKKPVICKRNKMRSVCRRKKDQNIKLIIAEITNDFFFFI